MHCTVSNTLYFNAMQHTVLQCTCTESDQGQPSIHYTSVYAPCVNAFQALLQRNADYNAECTVCWAGSAFALIRACHRLSYVPGCHQLSWKKCFVYTVIFNWKRFSKKCMLDKAKTSLHEIVYLIFVTDSDCDETV